MASPVHGMQGFGFEGQNSSFDTRAFVLEFSHPVAQWIACQGFKFFVILAFKVVSDPLGYGIVFDERMIL